MEAIIVGRNGKRGEVFQNLFSRCQYSVNILEQGNWVQVTSISVSANIVLISVPIMQVESVIRKISLYINKNVLLVDDITRVKRSVLKSMLRCRSGPALLALHQRLVLLLNFLLRVK